MNRIAKTLIGSAFVILTITQCSTAAVTSAQPEMHVEFDNDAATHLPQAAVRDWLQRSRAAVAHYYGVFPMRELNITIHDEDGNDVGYGSTTWEHGHGSIEITIGDSITVNDLMHAWTAVHEMTHLAMPILRRSDRWVAEGMATYIEPFARLQVGQMTREELWKDMVRNGPRALPSDGEGMRGTRDIGEMYWGGALWCLTADIAIRQKTNNRYGFQDAMRAIVRAHATADSDFSTEEALAFGDKAIGVSVLVPLYKQWSDGPVNVNVDGLWKKLGVVRDGRSVRFDESAPLAYIRRSIETGPR